MNLADVSKPRIPVRGPQKAEVKAKVEVEI
jgi:hypothetical protein